MKHYAFLLLALLFFGCKQIKKTKTTEVVTEKIAVDTTSTINEIEIKDTLMGNLNFKKTLSSIKYVKHTKDKHQDWMFDRASTLKPSLKLDYSDFKVKSTSYTYKKDLKFYLHTLTHTNDTISIKPFLENAQGKPTEGYTRERVLIFAMKNDNQANFIDIPEKLNPLKLREELLDTLYKRIDSDVIECYRSKKCVYKDLRKE